jgi:hypothetical protein
MWWQYVMVFLGAVLMDITPLPLPPAFTIMILLQIMFDPSCMAGNYYWRNWSPLLDGIFLPFIFQ